MKTNLKDAPKPIVNPDGSFVITAAGAAFIDAWLAEVVAHVRNGAAEKSIMLSQHSPK